MEVALSVRPIPDGRCLVFGGKKVKNLLSNVLSQLPVERIISSVYFLLLKNNVATKNVKLSR